MKKLFVIVTIALVTFTYTNAQQTLKEELKDYHYVMLSMVKIGGKYRATIDYGSEEGRKLILNKLSDGSININFGTENSKFNFKNMLVVVEYFHQIEFRVMDMEVYSDTYFVYLLERIESKPTQP